jgi:hypothetical protein
MKSKVLCIIVFLLTAGCAVTTKQANPPVWQKKSEALTTIFNGVPYRFVYYSHVPQKDVECVVITLPKPQFVSLAVVRTINGAPLEVYAAVLHETEWGFLDQLLMYTEPKTPFEQYCRDALLLLPDGAMEYFPHHWKIGQLLGNVERVSP